MGRRRKRRQSLPKVEKTEILDIGSEGVAIAKHEGVVIFVKNAIPGDIVDISVTKKKKNYFEGKAVKFHERSKKAITPFCAHFGICGGCRWQNLPYKEQLFYKEKQVKDNFERIAKVPLPAISSILPSQKTTYYRNKMEFSFSNKRWLTKEDDDGKEKNMNALGLHVPGFFEKIVDINHCYLQEEPSNRIRLSVRDFAIKNHFDFFDPVKQTGFLRNLIIRNTSTGELMVIIISHYQDEEKLTLLLDHIWQQFPGITSLNYVINDKKNDSLHGLTAENYKGTPFITEVMDDMHFRIAPLSFYQTNSWQAHELYKLARSLANIKSTEVVYDLYTGAGTIANYVARDAKKVIGIEYVETAIEDAKENAMINNIDNTVFYAGDMAKVLTGEFIEKNGNPDVVITDPPRAGMHPDVVGQLLKAGASRIVYVSCNPATQSRDVALLSEKYHAEAIQPVDMFPHTQHVENVVLLNKKTS